MNDTTQQYARCEHEEDGQRDCVTSSNLSFVPSASKVLCVFHKRQQEKLSTSGQRKSTQGANTCPHCGDTFDVRSAPGRRARSRARSIATSAFDRHVATCLTRQAILKAQSTTNTTGSN